MMNENDGLFAPVNSTASDESKVRLGRQQRAVLALFKKQPRVSNTELAKLSFRYGARIHELRRVGYEFKIVERNHETGVCVYTLTGEPGKEGDDEE